MKWKLLIGLCLVAALVVSGCKRPADNQGEEPKPDGPKGEEPIEPTGPDEPREVAFRVCGVGECEPCEGSERGIEVTTDISAQNPVECDWDPELERCTNGGSRLAFVLEGGAGQFTLEVDEKGESHSPRAWSNQRMTSVVREALVTEPAAYLNFREDGTTDWQYVVRVQDVDGPLACRDPVIFIHERPIG